MRDEDMQNQLKNNHSVVSNLQVDINNSNFIHQVKISKKKDKIFLLGNIINNQQTEMKILITKHQNKLINLITDQEGQYNDLSNTLHKCRDNLNLRYKVHIDDASAELKKQHARQKILENKFTKSLIDRNESLEAEAVFFRNRIRLSLMYSGH
jgi:hypothetical protein